MKTLSLLVLTVALFGCVDGSPVAPIVTKPEAKVLNLLASQQGDTLRLRADSTFEAKSAGAHLWVVGRYWFPSEPVNGVYRMCARPNAFVPDDFIDCYIWEPAPGVLQDPGSAFLRDGAVKYWSRI